MNYWLKCYININTIKIWYIIIILTLVYWSLYKVIKEYSWSYKLMKKKIINLILFYLQKTSKKIYNYKMKSNLIIYVKLYQKLIKKIKLKLIFLLTIYLYYFFFYLVSLNALTNAYLNNIAEAEILSNLTFVDFVTILDIYIEKMKDKRQQYK